MLLDLDGTLVDTAPLWRDAYRTFARELDVTLSDGFWSEIAGHSMHDSLRVLDARPALAHPTDDSDADALVARLVAIAVARITDPSASSAGWRWLPGARELMGVLREPHGGDGAADGAGPAPMTALVTSSWRVFAQAVLASSDAGSGWPSRPFDALVCGEDVTSGKPAPDGYLRAARLLDVDPADCLVVEDSPTGVAAAEAAGMMVLVVPRADAVDPAPGRAVRQDLGGLGLTELAGLHARLRSGASA